jgi:hypothetical protein
MGMSRRRLGELWSSRQWLVVLLAAMVLVFATGCGDSGPEVSAGQAVPTTTSSLGESASAGTTTSGVSAVRSLAYRGIRLEVPASWPIHDLAADPTECVRYDEHAVFLGPPGPKPTCPARVIGRTETVQVQPLGPATRTAEALASEALTINGLDLRVDPNTDASGVITAVAPSAAVLVAITFGGDRATAEAILASVRAA